LTEADFGLKIGSQRKFTMRKPIRCDKGKVGYFRLRRKNMNNIKYVEEENNRSIIIRRGCRKERILSRFFEHALAMQQIIIGRQYKLLRI